MLRYFVVMCISSLCLMLSACDVEESYDAEPSSFFHDRRIHPPTHSDNAKILITPHSVRLTKAHLTPVRTELYQPSFRLEGVITPVYSATIILPKAGKLDSLSVRLSDSVTKGMTLAHIRHVAPFDDENDVTSTLPDEIIAINAPIFGKVQEIFIHETHHLHPKGTALMTVADDEHLKLVSLLPKTYAKYLSVGKAVNFHTDDGQEFTGQIAKIEPNLTKSDTLQIHVHISPDEQKSANLHTGQWVSGYVEYGQTSVGALVPGFAIVDEEAKPMDLSALDVQPYKPATPIHAYLWLIYQDETLVLSATDIIEYRPTSGQYLVAGVPKESLISLAPLPKEASGKKARLDWSF